MDLPAEHWDNGIGRYAGRKLSNEEYLHYTRSRQHEAVDTRQQAAERSDTSPARQEKSKKIDGKDWLHTLTFRLLHSAHPLLDLRCALRLVILVVPRVWSEASSIGNAEAMLVWTGSDPLVPGNF